MSRTQPAADGSDEPDGALSAAVLLNARDPQLPAPAPPGLVPTNQRGVFRVPSAEMLANAHGSRGRTRGPNAEPLRDR